MDEEIDEWLDAVLDDLLWELELEEAKAWVDGLSQFPDAEIIPENSAEKTKGASNASP